MMQGIYPIFLKLAKVYLSIPATTISVESLFSDATIVFITEWKNRLGSEMVEALLFLEEVMSLNLF